MNRAVYLGRHDQQNKDFKFSLAQGLQPSMVTFVLRKLKIHVIIFKWFRIWLIFTFYESALVEYFISTNFCFVNYRFRTPRNCGRMIKELVWLTVGSTCFLLELILGHHSKRAGLQAV